MSTFSNAPGIIKDEGRKKILYFPRNYVHLLKLLRYFFWYFVPHSHVLVFFCKNISTFGKWFLIECSENEKYLLLIPWKCIILKYCKTYIKSLSRYLFYLNYTFDVKCSKNYIFEIIPLILGKDTLDWKWWKIDF